MMRKGWRRPREWEVSQESLREPQTGFHTSEAMELVRPTAANAASRWEAGTSAETCFWVRYRLTDASEALRASQKADNSASRQCGIGAQSWF